MADLTTAFRGAVRDALRQPGADVADAIIDGIGDGEIGRIGGDIIDLLTDLEEHLHGSTDLATMRLQARVSDTLDALGVPQIRGAA